MFNIDSEIVEKCQDINASALVNQLLTAHFDKDDFDKMPIEELEKKLKEQKLQDEYELKLKELKEENES